METFISLQPDQRTPKYKQVINSILAEIERGALKRGQRIPSINELSEEYYLSRDTVEKAYAELRERGIVASVRGKGYYIDRVDLKNPFRVLLLFNKISAYKKLVYNAFVATLGDRSVVDLHIHHCNAKVFEGLINHHLGNYHHYVLMPHFYDSLDVVANTLRRIPKDKLLLLDKDFEGLEGEYAAVYQDFEIDIHQALHSGTDLLRKYRKLTLVYPDGSIPYPKEIVTGFRNFCREAAFDYDILSEVTAATPLREQEAYVVIEETNLVNFIKQCRQRSWQLGRDAGLISYNETPLKEILADGITVISTDHEKMGETAACLLMDKEKRKVKNPFTLIRRSSL
ncbi:MAG: GntR family transcriptional regulator [Ferruginibacter sp.]|nr:GntR family transcriptional regulator [Cytophagales bacterium]